MSSTTGQDEENATVPGAHNSGTEDERVRDEEAPDEDDGSEVDEKKKHGAQQKGAAKRAKSARDFISYENEAEESDDGGAGSDDDDDDDEEEDDDDEATAEEMRGFIASDDDDDEDEEGDDDDDDENPSKRPKKEALERDFDEDDILMLRDALGKNADAILRKARKKIVGAPDEDDDDEEGGNTASKHVGAQSSAPADTQALASRVLDDDEDEEDGADMTGIVTSTMEEHGDGADGSARISGKRRANGEGVRRARHSSDYDALMGTGEDVDEDDGYGYRGYGDDEDAYDEESAADSEYMEKMRQQRLKAEALSGYEPIELIEGYKTKEDDVIRENDLPERYQLKYSAQFEPPPSHVIDAETEWVFEQLYVRLCARRITRWNDPVLSQIFHPDRATDAAAAEMVPAIRYVIQCLHNDVIANAPEEIVEHLKQHDMAGDMSGPREVPFIAYHRQGGSLFPRTLNMHDLWYISAYLHKASDLLERKSRIHDVAEAVTKAIGTDDHRFSLLQNTDFVKAIETIEQLNDAIDFFSHFFADLPVQTLLSQTNSSGGDGDEDSSGGLSQQSSHKPRRRRAGHYSLCNSVGITGFIKHFGLAIQDVVDILNGRQTPMTPSESTPEQCADDFLRTAFNTSEKVISAAVACFADEISRHPEVRSFWRARLLESIENGGGVFINIRPTPQGYRTIKEWERYARFEYLTEKPVCTLEDETFLWMEKAEQDKLLTIDMIIDSAFVNDMKRTVMDSCQPELPTEASLEWEQLFARVIDRAHEALAVHFVGEIKQRLRDEAAMCVTEYCANFVRNVVSHSPFRPAHAPMSGNVSTAVIGADRSDPSYFFVVSPEGEVLDWMELKYLTQRRRGGDSISEELRAETTAFTTMLTTHRPDVIGLGADSVSAYYLRRHIAQIVDELVARSVAMDLEEDGASSADREDDGERDRFGSKKSASRSGGDAKAPKKLENISVELVAVDVARVWAASRRSESEFPKFDFFQKMAVSLARQLLAPEIEIASLFGPQRDILCIHMHPLQATVNKDDLFSALYQEVMTAVAHTGVDISAALQYQHVAYSLEFVCGLGPRKASHLIEVLKRREQLTSRVDLFSLLGPRVAYNAASFLLPSKNARRFFKTGGQPLDITRMHPEIYHLATKIAVDATGQGDATLKTSPSMARRALLEVMSGKESLLDTLDLRALRERLSRTRREHLVHSIDVICKELVAPYSDARLEFRSLVFSDQWRQAPTELDFFLFMAITGCALEYKGPPIVPYWHNRNEYMFHEWLPMGEGVSQFQVVECRVTRVENDKVFVRCSNDLPGIIFFRDLSDKDPQQVAGRLETQTILSARVLAVELPLLRLKLSSKGSELRGQTYDYSPESWGYDRYFDTEAQKEFKKEMDAPKATEKARYKKRLIQHPSFQNKSYHEVKVLLDEIQPGNGIFRPSSKGLDHLTLSWKYAPGLVAHVTIDENPDLKETPHALSSQLFITLGTAKYEYEELDHILSDFVDSSYALVVQIVKNKYFLNKKPEEVADVLRERKAANPSTIPYNFSPRDGPDCSFWLSFLPGKSVYKWHVKVYPDGLILGSEKFSSIADLLRWFKAGNFQRIAAMAKKRALEEAKQKQRTADVAVANDVVERQQQKPQQPLKKRELVPAKKNPIRDVSSTAHHKYRPSAHHTSMLTPTRASRKDDYDAYASPSFSRRTGAGMHSGPHHSSSNSNSDIYRDNYSTGSESSMFGGWSKPPSTYTPSNDTPAQPGSSSRKASRWSSEPTSSVTANTVEAKATQSLGGWGTAPSQPQRDQPGNEVATPVEASMTVPTSVGWGEAKTSTSGTDAVTHTSSSTGGWS